MKKIITVITLVTICFYSCNKDELDTNLNLDDDMSFTGTLETEQSEENISEDVNLKISKGYYQCTTSLPYGYGAGIIELKGKIINFIDTASIAIPSLYGQSYVLSGEHYYNFDGNNLEIWREKNVGRVRYKLELED